MIAFVELFDFDVKILIPSRFGTESDCVGAGRMWARSELDDWAWIDACGCCLDLVVGWRYLTESWLEVCHFLVLFEK